jgi:hypothetical protein
MTSNVIPSKDRIVLVDRTSLESRLGLFEVRAVVSRLKREGESVSMGKRGERKKGRA